MEDVVYSFAKKLFRQPGLRGGSSASAGNGGYGGMTDVVIAGILCVVFLLGRCTPRTLFS